ncbi:MAG: hypothetical protein CVV12_05510 [Gammaproteobacteria bacterium HGW-Gammaproteobacteria-2]|jgi:regulator of protease activity HflC (stomatin/prohibitin superfamily)|nr:MAG: hypothetical protein CVV12_05510 [Gammaproteobacteria bacterium HGW-Gammaproteobacteria-2]
MNVFTFLLASVVVLATVAVAGLRHVPQGQVFTVHRFGRYRRTLGPGLRWVLPGFDRIGHHVSLIGHHVAVPMALNGPAASADLYYQILDPTRTGAVLDDVDALIQQQTHDALQALHGQNAPDKGMVALAESLKHEVNRRINALGLRVIRCAVYPG